MKFNYFFRILISFLFLSVNAQEPDWSVDGSKYQFTMNITTFLNVNGTTLSSSEDKVAVFVGEEIRGVANLAYVAKYDKYVAFLTIYSNTSSEQLNFKIYDSTNDTVVNVIKTESFVIDSSLGSVFQSYSIANPELSSEASLLSFSFLNIGIVEEKINGNQRDFVLPIGTDLTTLKPQFTISEGAQLYVLENIQTSGQSIQNFTKSITYSVLSENQAVLNTIQINVTVEEKSVNPPVVVLSSEEEGSVNTIPVSVSLKTNVSLAEFNENNFVLVNALVSSIKEESDLSYTIEIVPIQQGVFSIELLEGRLYNLENEPNETSSKLSFIYDAVNPYVVAVKRKTPLDEITKNDILVFEVVFSEDVEGVSITNFKSVTGANISVEKSKQDYTYEVTVNNLDTYYGVVPLYIIDSDKIKDKAGNLLINSVFNAYQN
ncbi:hypothetical protein [uncultured Polaribacter sp.]|uniref:hypothetical protein n=1 Tax=uncultured Polaribacter sp. TaxID=174711 RepID=UPI00260B0215|nr:hypothetical protein [uncultured Polaribacter sp.]